MSNELKLKNNLNLWNAVKTTDISKTKTTEIKRRKITSIDPQYQFQTASEQFGSFGMGWGVYADSVKISYKKIAETELLCYDAVMYYEYDGSKGELPISAVEKIAYMTKGYQGKDGYLVIDEMAQRKAETSAITKGLSRLGFNADIFLGMFEDQEYVSQIAVEQAIEKSEDKESEVELQCGEIKKYMEESIKAYNVKEIDIKGISRMYKKDMIYLNNRSSIVHLAKAAQFAMKMLEKEYNAIKEKKSEA